MIDKFHSRPSNPVPTWLSSESCNLPIPSLNTICISVYDVGELIVVVSVIGEAYSFRWAPYDFMALSIADTGDDSRIPYTGTYR